MQTMIVILVAISDPEHSTHSCWSVAPDPPSPASCCPDHTPHPLCGTVFPETSQHHEAKRRSFQEKEGRIWRFELRRKILFGRRRGAREGKRFRVSCFQRACMYPCGSVFSMALQQFNSKFIMFATVCGQDKVRVDSDEKLIKRDNLQCRANG